MDLFDIHKQSKQHSIVDLKCTVCFFSFVFRNRAAVSLFWDLWATQIEDLGFEHDIQGVQN